MVCKWCTNRKPVRVPSEDFYLEIFDDIDATKILWGEFQAAAHGDNCTADVTRLYTKADVVAAINAHYPNVNKCDGCVDASSLFHGSVRDQIMRAKTPREFFHGIRMRLNELESSDINYNHDEDCPAGIYMRYKELHTEFPGLKIKDSKVSLARLLSGLTISQIHVHGSNGDGKIYHNIYKKNLLSEDLSFLAKLQPILEIPRTSQSLCPGCQQIYAALYAKFIGDRVLKQCHTKPVLDFEKRATDTDDCKSYEEYIKYYNIYHIRCKFSDLIFCSKTELGKHLKVIIHEQAELRKRLIDHAFNPQKHTLQYALETLKKLYNNNKVNVNDIMPLVNQFVTNCGVESIRFMCEKCETESIARISIYIVFCETKSTHTQDQYYADNLLNDPRDFYRRMHQMGRSLSHSYQDTKTNCTGTKDACHTVFCKKYEPVPHRRTLLGEIFDGVTSTASDDYRAGIFTKTHSKTCRFMPDIRTSYDEPFASLDRQINIDAIRRAARAYFVDLNFLGIDAVNKRYNEVKRFLDSLRTGTVSQEDLEKFNISRPANITLSQTVISRKNTIAIRDLHIIIDTM